MPHLFEHLVVLTAPVTLATIALTSLAIHAGDELTSTTPASCVPC